MGGKWGEERGERRILRGMEEKFQRMGEIA
jgi:hypothetical protein